LHEDNNVIPFAQILIVILLSLTAAGCVFIDGEHVSRDDWKELQRDNRDAISNLEIGMSRSAALERLGTPTDSEAFTRDGEEVRVLFYRTQHKRSDGETSRDETTPLVFRNDQLVGWGDAVYHGLH
jgi:outer membrane protein assembly factor BamE (lipoprotein component of BamABCDE complex)